MKLRLKKIDPISAGKVMGGLYAALGLMFVPFFLMMGVFAALASHANANVTVHSSGPMGGAMLPGMGVFAGMGLFFVVMLPVIYGVFGFVAGALLALVYNLICRWVGGLELDFERMDDSAGFVPVTPSASEPPPPPPPVRS